MLLIWILTLLQHPTVVRSIPLSPLVSKQVEAPYARASPSQDQYLQRYYPNSTAINSNRESYQSINVSTITVSSAIIQVPAPNVDSNANTAGFVVTSLETGGRASVIPLLTVPIPSPTALLEYAECTLKMSNEPTKPTDPVSSNIFGTPIATSKPSKIFEERKDHPAPRIGIRGSGPYGTNKFYANFFLGNQNSPAYVHPYSLAWSKGQGSTSSWGIAISHVEASQRVYGETQPETGAAKYFLNPIGIQSLCLSASELGSKTSLTTDNMSSHSANINLHADSKSKSLITFPLVQGMAFVTAIYNGGTPVIETGVLFKTVTRSAKGPQSGVTKYTFHLDDGKVWHVYGYSEKGDPFDLTVLDNRVAKAGKPFRGIVQVAKDPENAESIIDAAAGAYPVGMVLSGTSSGSKGTYTFQYQKAGFSKVKLLMYALPHHYESFDTATAKATSTVKLQTTTKGMAKAVVADSWTMIEPKMPVSMGFAPWDPIQGPKDKLSDSATKAITPVALKELSQNVDQQSNQDSMYFGGKALAKFAAICFTANNMLKNPKMAQAGLEKLKSAFARFITNKQQFPLYYESAWGGLVSSASYKTGNNGADFGNTFYNDHHFHYGYFIYAAAVIGYLDPSWLTKENVEYINTLVRDVANPSTADRYFPVSRNFDWYHGHSWAHGLYETLDGKDQESSSEDAMAAYAIKMWGRTIKDANMEARGNLMLSIIARSLNQYYLYTTQNKIQPEKYIGNRVAGILFENKCDHTTYFGANIEYVQGIHMLPLLPSTKFTRPADFVKEEWAAFFDKGRADKVEGGWKSILYGNLATIDPKAAWTFFTDKSFDPAWLDGGASLTWYQAYAAAFM
ncbi:glycoside hydrolase family 81 protein [Xylaria bambusicola]|uniref:glycoside hydrolase family 81 protein n=1 Tax=Xylaria bambusicola TaxID=326684 RepID=UPI0020085C4A|nr:glycoside hydrolase family 81 protein [Xylaria bambusicola]KAI0514987.1 glycoside hydrolase family 81 protein [Xylaria bambusicola]